MSNGVERGVRSQAELRWKCDGVKSGREWKTGRGQGSEAASQAGDGDSKVWKGGGCVKPQGRVGLTCISNCNPSFNSRTGC